MLSTFLTSAVIALAPVEDPAPALEKYTLMTPDIYHTITRPIDSLVKKQQLSTKYTQRDEIMQEIRIEQILEEIENLSDTIEDLLIALHEEEIELTKDECLYLITTDLELIDFTFNNDEI
ncbi:MAG: hypothetical protein LBD11_06665 [Candidatus Peribacteria bacterium]|jgi:hypothetical protein|nr:hypothetical protein [Candidatus Peribacteria bacterium]